MKHLDTSTKFSESQGKVILVHAPGRLNIIGEHTDYNDGFVLPAAIDKRIELRLKSNGRASLCHMHASDMDEDYTFDLNDFSPLEGGWQNYLLGVVHEMQKKGIQLQGFDCEFGGNIPIGGGVSSSAALECAIAFGLNELLNLGFNRFDLVKMGQMAEHNFVGTKCGIMDQFASMMGKKNSAILLDCRSLEHQYVPIILDDFEFLLINSNVTHNLADSAYNTRREECQAGVHMLRKFYPKIDSLRDVKRSQLEQQRANIPEPIYSRCLHVVSENERVLKAVESLKEGNLPMLGKLMYQSHASLKDSYEVSCAELDFLVEKTADKDYILGSRMMGGGFGGCTLNLIKKSEKDAFLNELIPAYKTAFGTEPTPFNVSIEDGVHGVPVGEK
ncbi:MAG: galactokinase [Bacteroidia bacterium]